MKIVRSVLVSAGLLIALGCHSAFIDATISNQTDKPITLVEVDYPSASFGTQSLAPGGTFHYRFKVQGSGALTLLYTNAANKEQNIKGPVLHDNDEGKLDIIVSSTGTKWLPQLKTPSR
jgi:hypothetical protein